MFRFAQQAIGAGDRAKLAVGHESATAQAFERGQGAGDAQARLAPTPDQLQALYEEFGLANAARAELEIALRVGRKLAPRSLDELGKRGGDAGIDFASKNERRNHLAFDHCSERGIAGDGSRS